jgi:hypothetical protein
MVSRRTRFREHMARLDAAADPYQAIERKLYVDRPGSAAERIVRRLELKPASTHLLVGGIGCGKTTQLLIARDRLNDLGDTLAIYVDVSRRLDLAKAKPGSLLAVAGLAIGEQPVKNPDVPNHEQTLQWFRDWAMGREASISDVFPGSVGRRESSRLLRMASTPVSSLIWTCSKVSARAGSRRAKISCFSSTRSIG